MNQCWCVLSLVARLRVNRKFYMHLKCVKWLRKWITKLSFQRWMVPLCVVPWWKNDFLCCTNKLLYQFWLNIKNQGKLIFPNQTHSTFWTKSEFYYITHFFLSNPQPRKTTQDKAAGFSCERRALETRITSLNA